LCGGKQTVVIRIHVQSIIEKSACSRSSSILRPAAPTVVMMFPSCFHFTATIAPVLSTAYICTKQSVTGSTPYDDLVWYSLMICGSGTKSVAAASAMPSASPVAETSTWMGAQYVPLLAPVPLCQNACAPIVPSIL
jgi:hypothetical protein